MNENSDFVLLGKNLEQYIHSTAIVLFAFDHHHTKNHNSTKVDIIIVQIRFIAITKVKSVQFIL
jgi:hypothetical protein